jgi:enoyl-[acyl-carrier protein] reductase I
MAKLSEPLMTAGGCLLAMSYYGAERAIAHYNVMGPVKAALEAAVRYMVVELGLAGIRVNALPPGPVKPARLPESSISTSCSSAQSMKPPSTGW